MQIDKVLPISKTKFVDLAVISLSFIKSIFGKALNWLRPLANQVATFELINNSLNLELLYPKLVDIIKL